MYIIRCICLWMILGLMACSGPVRIQKNLEVKPGDLSGLCGCDNPAEYSSLEF